MKNNFLYDNKNGFTLKVHPEGFTLLEMLVVISIVSVIAVFGVGVLSTVLNGGSKTAIISEIKQNGNYVMENMSRYIRNAISISSCPGNNTLSLVQPDNSVVSFSVLSEDGVNFNNRIASNSSTLTNGDRKNGVNVTNLTFTCDPNLNPPVVTIDFTLTQGLGVGSGQQNQATETFHTSVSLRTY